MVKRLMATGLALVVAAMVGGPWTAPAHGQAPAAFRTPLTGEPPTLDPYFAVDSASAPIVFLMYSTLVSLDSTGRLRPQAATSWDVSPNGLIYTFHLRDNVYFHSGRKVTAADWKWSFERMGSPALKSPVGSVVVTGIQGYDAFQSGAPGIAGIVAVDPLTLRITLNPARRGGFLNRLAYYAAVVLDRDVVQRGGSGWFETQDAGTGPFMLREWAHNDHLSLPAFSKYYEGAPKIAEVSLPIVTETTTQLSEYLSGQLDFVPVPLGDYQRIQADPTLSKQLLVYPRAQILYLGLNPRVYAPFKDPRVRRAFAMAIDKPKISKTVFFGFFTPANSIVPPGIPGFYAGYKGLPYDPGAAKKLLDEAGVAGRLPPLQIAMNPFGPVAQMETEPVAAMLKETLGVDVQPQKTEFSNFIANLNRRTVYQAFMTGWSADYLDYSDYLDLLLYSSSPLNRQNYESSAFDKFIDQANAAPNDAERVSLYHRAEALAVEDATIVPMLFTQFAYLKKPYVQGLQTSPAVNGWLPFSGVRIVK
ncbi:MAG TPA: ABC transporter substrate-binding protein [bacterium]|nr:ABC transporter substrate-binding protein [bacterium]